MSDFRKAFYDIVDGQNVKDMDDRIREKMEFFGITYEDAMRIDRDLMQLCRNVSRITGDRIDRLPPHLRNAALRNYLCSIATLMNQMSEFIAAVDCGVPLELIGMSETPGCDCVGCNTKRKLRHEIQSAGRE